jgi:rhodanese-related sulfurtransferase
MGEMTIGKLPGGARPARAGGADVDIPDIDRAELARRIESGDVTVVEALPEHVYAGGHLPGAINIRPRRVAELAPALLPDQTAHIVVYCDSGTCDASLRVARQLAESGYRNVARYVGGKQDWTAAGLPTETGENSAVS